ncbi:hypothetical protein U9M48_042249 [Paspalum notatum var. saurae]|uniref:Uncharacterized protein n=1 Tax=Paspalum notatum var. saurae TaxID=547442 RepID=A0AAQ3UUD4_PASNO
MEFYRQAVAAVMQAFFMALFYFLLVGVLPHLCAGEAGEQGHGERRAHRRGGPRIQTLGIQIYSEDSNFQKIH